ncbi:biotin--acetyl-CoA-carboxylase ligase [Lysinibacillus contaminans]|uniref:Bifunctional ligase/repressor BirA n=1 Tax=Lysinibacillus contaminans TaxID=1293441 RepID=A0ABR5K2J5_9BACI|nr:biotin--[acetyl-CoA-carboxylase] ligase [Lysinibacillus contaminans]KOS69138.1 biotin--acetyl-CoA-carboxylase ligase [Lysinibacillus contaminans]
MSISMKDEILRRLLAANGEAVSGQELADTLNVSRTAIWKHMQGLQEEGYTFETVKKKGYILTGVPNSLSPMQIELFLNTERFGRTIHHFDVVDSTQTIAHKLAQEGAPDGTIVIGEEQTAGRGRMARPWESAHGTGIWMTIIVRPDVTPQQASSYTLVVAVAVSKAIKALYKNVEPAIKWPNDLLINGKKCTGILTEMQAEADCVQALLVGIGINANQVEADFSPEIADIATSLRLAAGEEINRAALVATILQYLEQYTEIFVKESFTSIKKEWEQASCTIGQRIEVTTIRERFEGVASGITDEGVLQLRQDDGTVRTIYSGDVRII